MKINKILELQMEMQLEQQFFNASNNMQSVILKASDSPCDKILEYTVKLAEENYLNVLESICRRYLRKEISSEWFKDLFSTVVEQSIKLNEKMEVSYKNYKNNCEKKYAYENIIKVYDTLIAGKGDVL